MSTDAPTTETEPRRFSIRLPRSLWIGVATVALVVVAFALRIRALPGLETLFLSNTWITDAGLRELEEMKSLGFISVHGTHVTGAALLD
jgi:hypothetical protein